MDCYLFFSLLNLLIFLLLPVVAFSATKIEHLRDKPCPYLWLSNLSFLGLCSKSSQFYSFCWECSNTQPISPSFSQPWENSSLESSGVDHTCIIRAPFSYLVWMETHHEHCPQANHEGITQPPKSIRQHLPGSMRPWPSSLGFDVKSAKFWATWMFYS